MSKPNFGGYAFNGSGGTGMPDATVAGRINQFIMIGLSGTATNNAYSVQWCAIGDPNDWPIPGSNDARTKQAGIQILSPEHGKVTGIAGNDFFAYIFQERAVTKATYVGGDVVFSFDTFEESRGCLEYDRFEQVDDLVVFQSETGYHSLQNDVISDIGFGVVDDSYTPTTEDSAIEVVKNPLIHTIFFGDHDLAYNYKTGQFTRVPLLAGNRYYSIYSKTGIIGQLRFSGSAFSMVTADSTGSAPATATVVTGDFELNPSGRAVVDASRPITEGASVSSVRIGVKDFPSDSVTWATGTALNSRTGMSNFRGGANTPEGRYHRAEYVFTGGFTTITGADFEFFPTGKL